jgi:hypothetical protein
MFAHLARAISHAVIRSIALLALANTIASAQLDEWHRLWIPNGAVLPEPVKVKAPALGDLGPELESAEWLMVSTKYHQIHYQASMDMRTLTEVYQVIDNLYDFLSRRSPANAKWPVRVFLVPGERGRSRVSPQAVAMRTGADADAAFIIGSLMHEETHLFNFAFLGAAAQGWWTGEFTCIYHQERARLTRLGADLKSELARQLPNGPSGALASLEGPTQSAFYSATSALYFQEETYGAARMIEFRRLSLMSSKATNGQALPASVFRQVFGKDAVALDSEWRASIESRFDNDEAGFLGDFVVQAHGERIVSVPEDLPLSSVAPSSGADDPGETVRHERRSTPSRKGQSNHSRRAG